MLWNCRSYRPVIRVLPVLHSFGGALRVSFFDFLDCEEWYEIGACSKCLSSLSKSGVTALSGSWNGRGKRCRQKKRNQPTSSGCSLVQFGVINSGDLQNEFYLKVRDLSFLLNVICIFSSVVSQQVMGSVSPPSLRCIPVDAPIEEFINAITKDGGCICADFVSPEAVAKANAEVQPFLDADKPWQVSNVLIQQISTQLSQKQGQAISPRDKTLQPPYMAKPNMS